MTIAREAWVFVLPVAAAALAAGLLGRPRLALAVALLAVLVAAFFRVPRRQIDAPADVLLAPANGTVTGIETLTDPRVGPGRFQRVTTFLSVFNVHVQRAPFSGRVIKSELTPKGPVYTTLKKVPLAGSQEREGGDDGENGSGED